MKNVNTIAAVLVALLGTSTLAFAADAPAANTIGFTMNAGTIGTSRAVTQTGAGNGITATLNGSIKTMSFNQTGNTNTNTLVFGGSTNAVASYAMTAIGNSNVVSSTIGAVSGAFTYVLDLVGNSNIVNETFAASNSVDADTDIAGNSNTMTMVIDALALVSDYIVSGSTNSLNIQADGALNTFTSYINVLGDDNTITDTVGALVTSVNNNIVLTGSTNNLELIQNAVTSNINATITASALDMDIDQLGATSNILTTTVVAGSGATYAVTQSAATSTFTDVVNLAAGGSSTVTISN